MWLPLSPPETIDFIDIFMILVSEPPAEPRNGGVSRTDPLGGPRSASRRLGLLVRPDPERRTETHHYVAARPLPKNTTETALLLELGGCSRSLVKLRILLRRSGQRIIVGVVSTKAR